MTREENDKRLARLKNIVLNMPEKPGSYQFYDKDHVIIYVGSTKLSVQTKGSSRSTTATPTHLTSNVCVW